MILIALGANLGGRAGPPARGLDAAIVLLQREGVRTLRRSRWYVSAPVPRSAQPSYVNGVVVVDTLQRPKALLRRLKALEKRFGRMNGTRNAPRVLDLDLLDWRGLVTGPDGVPPELPHPRMSGRAFVLLPLLEVAPRWRHPVSGKSARTLLAELPPIGRPVLLPKRGRFVCRTV